MTNFLSRSLKALAALLFALPVVSPSVAQEVDVYFITGQSNAGNMGEMNSYDVQGYNGYDAAMFSAQTQFNFELTFARIRDRSNTFANGAPRVGGPVTDVVEAFSGQNMLDPVNYAVDNIAVQLNAEFGNDIGIFSYGRNGRALANITDESWFPGTVSNPFNDELYGYFQTWSQDRLDEIEAGSDGVAGTADDRVANVRGIFWFQGENDADDAGARAAYQTNFENLIARFRADFNDPELPIVASEIRELNSNDASINQSLNAVAASDDFVTVIDISDASTYIPVSANDVHVSALGLLPLSDDFAEQMIILQGGEVDPPEPTVGGLTFATDIPTDVLFGTSNGEDAQGSASSQATFGFRNADADGQEGTRARGQSFTFVTEDGLTHEIGSLSVSLNAPADDAGFRPDGQLELTIFEWDSSDPDDFTIWDTGTGGEFTSGHNELYRQSFPVLSTDSWGNGDLAQISFEAGQLQLTDGNTYGFLFRYTLDSLVDAAGNALNEDVTIAFDVRQDNGIAGALLNTNPAGSFATADNGQSTSRDMNFFFAPAPASSVLLGDVNLDATVDFLDISPFIGLLTSSTFQAEGDVNQDGAVDFLDIAPFIQILSGG